MGQQFAEMDTQVGIMFVDAKFFTDIAAHIVVAPHLDIRAHFSSFQPHGIKAAIVDFPLNLLKVEKKIPFCLLESRIISTFANEIMNLIRERRLNG